MAGGSPYSRRHDKAAFSLSGTLARELQTEPRQALITCLFGLGAQSRGGGGGGGCSGGGGVVMAVAWGGFMSL